MRIILEIPEEFEPHFEIDRFEDSLHRLSADAHLIAGNYEQEVAKMLINAFRNAEVVKDTPKINPLPLNKKFIEITDDDFEIGENLKRLIEKTMIEILGEEE